ncbi:uncharacterized protein [Cherax quadricarinatus]|uniref:uncharacterized protein isoform X2 n=1 Tax=Cherax quadricarinatus TaxID=27406 RepID=UPI0023788603|nr:uncharacterized protein LOC128699315 isoform X2 [Cherax quadricarinatus]
MKPMYLLVLLYVYLVKVESAVTDQPPLDETAGTDEGSGNYEQLDEFTLNDTLADRAVCRFHDACQDAGGVCTSSCSNSDKISRRSCGSGCTCCAAKSSSKCRSKAECRSFGGVCQKAACKTNQLQLPSGCLTSSCRCCIAGTAAAAAACTGNEECWEFNGQCQTTPCAAYQQQIPGGCSGSGCICCAPIIRDSGNNTKYRQLNKTPETMIHLSDGVNEENEEASEELKKDVTENEEQQ